MNNLIEYINSRLQRRLIVYMLPLILVPLIVVTVLLVNQWVASVTAVINEAEEERVSRQAFEFQFELNVAEADILFLSRSDGVLDLANDLATGNTEELAGNRAQVASDFVGFAEARGIYQQVRFLDVRGQEVVRVDSDGVSAEAIANLQDKSDTDYYQGTIAKPPGEIFVSELNLNQEGNPRQIQVLEDGSVVPVIRYGIPVYVTVDDQPRLSGIIVTNVYANSFLSLLELGAEGQQFLLNQDGYYLFNSADPNTAFGFEEGIGELGFEEGATISNFLNEQESAQVLNGVGLGNVELTTDDNFLVHSARVSPPSADYFWVVGSARDTSVLFAEVRNVITATVVGLVTLSVLAIALTTFVASQIATPLQVISDRATRIASGDLNLQLEDTVQRSDEIGTLSQAFNSMAAQLKELVGGLEARVAARTADLETAAEIASAANEVREVEDLLSLTVNLVRDRFNFYYVQIYLIDDDNQYAVLKDGTGYVGRQLLVREHKLPLDGRSLVAESIRTGQFSVVQDTAKDPNFLPNDLLPDTRSELTVPLRTKGTIIGALDIQHNEANPFDETALQLFEALAEQLATTFENVQLYADTERRARELETVSQVSAEAIGNLNLKQLLWTVSNLTRKNFSLYHAHIYLMDDNNENLVLAAGSGEAGRDMVEAGHSIPVDRENSLVARAARTNEGVISNDVTKAPDFLPNPLLPDTQSEMAIPIAIGNEILGVLDVQADVTNRFDDEDVQVKSTLASQIAVAISNARVFEQSEKRASELATVAEVSTAASTTLDVDDLLWSVSNLTRDNFNLYHAHIYTLNDAGTKLILRAGAGEAGRAMVEEGHSIPIDHEHSLVASAARRREGVVVNDVTQDPDFLPNTHLPETRSEMAIPMIAGSELIGVLDVQANITDRFMDEDVQIKTTLASQIAVAVKNARLFKDVTDIRSAIDESAIVATTDQTGKITYVNDKFCEISKYSREELIGQDHRIINSGYHSQEFIKNVWVTIANGGVWTGEFCNRAKDDSIYWVDTTIVPFLNDQGKPVQYIAIRYDITDRKAQEESIKKRATEMETVAKVSAATTTILNVDDLLKSVVDLTKEAFNLYHAHIYLLDENSQQLVLTAGAGEAGDIMREQGHHIPLSGENSIVARAARARDGVIVNDVREAPDFLPNPLLPETRSEMAIPMTVGDELIGVLDVQASITDRFSEEDVRIKTTLASQVAVAVRNALAFEHELQTIERLREVDRLKQQFLANMSHELRTPLNSIIGYSEVLLDGVDGELEEDAVEDVQAIHDSGKHLLSIINEILDLAKIEAGQMQLDFKKQDMTTLLAEIVKSGQILVKDKGVELELIADGEIMPVNADIVRMRQVMWNLVSNAVKFTEQGSVKVRVSMTEDDRVLVKVVDTGIGISEEDQDLVFERFRQADGSTTRRAGGTGLGLTITRQLIQMHGGDLHLESEFGVGSTFYFSIPAYESAQEPVAVSESVNGNGAHPHA